VVGWTSVCGLDGLAGKRPRIDRYSMILSMFKNKIDVRLRQRKLRGKCSKLGLFQNSPCGLILKKCTFAGVVNDERQKSSSVRSIVECNSSTEFLVDMYRYIGKKIKSKKSRIIRKQHQQQLTNSTL
jgi:hypothetical protein